GFGANLGANLLVSVRTRKTAVDRRDAAVHEAGHLVMARHLEAAGPRAWIYPVERTAIGRTWNGDFNFFPFDMPPQKLALIGVAGVVAVTTWQRRWRACRSSNIDWEDPGTMSQSDWRYCGCDPGRVEPHLLEAADHAFRLFDPDH